MRWWSVLPACLVRHCSASGPSGGTGGSEPHAGAVQGCPQTETSVLSPTTAREPTLTRHVWGLSFCAPSEAVKFEISGGRYSSCSCVSFLLGTSSSSSSPSGLSAVYTRSLPDLAAFNGGMTKYASRTEGHWIDVCAAYEPELVLPRQVSRQATSRNPGGLQGSWFPASLTRKTYEDQDLIATAALPCPCCPDRSSSTTGRSTRPVPPRPVADGRRR